MLALVEEGCSTLPGEGELLAVVGELLPDPGEKGQLAGADQGLLEDALRCL